MLVAKRLYADNRVESKPQVFAVSPPNASAKTQVCYRGNGCLQYRRCSIMNFPFNGREHKLQPSRWWSSCLQNKGRKLPRSYVPPSCCCISEFLSGVDRCMQRRAKNTNGTLFFNFIMEVSLINAFELAAEKQAWPIGF